MATFSSYYSMFDHQTAELLKNVRIIDKSINEEHREEDQDTTVFKGKVHSQVKTGISCLVCEVAEFDSVKAQREHFKLDWHRYNVKQRLMDKPATSEEDFEETISGELSSISGSDSSESEDTCSEDFELEGIQEVLAIKDDIKEESAAYRQSHPKLFLCSDDGCVFTVYRATVLSPKNIPEKESELIKRLKELTGETLWVIVMTAGGHFAAAVFDGNAVVVHKTFHRYTVRAKRGTAQGMRDSQQGRQPKSAGASLRRYNEAALLQEVQEMLSAWSEYLDRCQKIFIRIPTYNKPMFFGGKNPPLNKNDPRIRTIPFSTRRPTFKEVKRVQEELSRVQILGQEREVLNEVLYQLSPKKPHPTLPKASHTPGKPALLGTPSDIPQTHSIDGDERMNHSKDDSIEHEIGSLREDVGSSTNTSGKKGKKKKNNVRIADRTGQEKVSAVTRCPDREVVLPDHHFWNRFYCAVVSGNIKVIAELLPNKELKDKKTLFKNLVHDKSTQEEECSKHSKTEHSNEVDVAIDGLVVKDKEQDICSSDLDKATVDPYKVLNERWGEDGSTLLHAASRASQTEIIYTLLHHGADPCIRDDGGRTAYDKAKSKEARDQFRRFMADYPDEYDYSKSHIPSPLTQEMKDEKERKESEKKKAQRKAKKLRAKEQKENEQKKQEEVMERKKKETMSEREKRALAAERRFSKQQEKNSGLSCAMCSQDLAGRVPFERLSYKYCSTACVRQHRLILENKGR